MTRFRGFPGTQRISFVMVFGTHLPKHSVCLYVPFQTQYTRCLFQPLPIPDDLHRKKITQPRNHRIQSLDPKPFARLELVVQKTVERLDFGQFLKNLQFILGGKVGLWDLLNLAHEPSLLSVGSNVIVLNAQSI